MMKAEFDMLDIVTDAKWKGQVHIDSNCLTIGADALSMADGDFPPVALERVDGEFKLYIWSDIEDDEPTHVISLEGARKTNDPE